MPVDYVHLVPPPRTRDMTSASQDNARHNGGGADHSPSISAECLAQLVRQASKVRAVHKTGVG
jgi:hypothetical protein